MCIDNIAGCDAMEAANLPYGRATKLLCLEKPEQDKGSPSANNSCSFLMVQGIL